MTTRIVSMFSSSLAAFILGLLLSPGLMRSGDPQRADAAFSDGVFQATLDFQSGRKPHLVSGRWNADRDRSSFVNGYQQRWRELFKDTASPLPVVDDAQLSGYWDGVVEGAKDGKSSQPFQVAGGDKSQVAAASHSVTLQRSRETTLPQRLCRRLQSRILCPARTEGGSVKPRLILLVQPGPLHPDNGRISCELRLRVPDRAPHASLFSTARAEINRPMSLNHPTPPCYHRSG